MLKSYEDIIVTELQSLYPEFKNLLTRTKTAKKGESEDGLNSIRRSSNASDSSDVSSYKSYFSSSCRVRNESTFDDINNNNNNSINNTFNGAVKYE